MKLLKLTGLFLLILAGAFCALGAYGASPTSSTQSLLLDRQLVAAGLVRPWFNQVQIDSNKEQVAFVTLQDNTLFIVTESGHLQVIDGDSGTTLWQCQVGEARFSTFAPVANSNVVAVVNGTKLYIYDRIDGKKLLETPLYGQPSAGPQLSERQVFIPMINKKISAYPLKRIVPERPNYEMSLKRMNDVKKKVRFTDNVEAKISDVMNQNASSRYILDTISTSDVRDCVTLGNVFVRPTLADQSNGVDTICWTTDDGWLLFGRLDYIKMERTLDLMYRIAIRPHSSHVDARRIRERFTDFNNPIASGPTYLPQDTTWANQLVKESKREGGLILVGAGDGHVLAVNSAKGEVRWKFMANSSVRERIYAYGDYAYVPTGDGTLYCLSVNDGLKVWESTDIKRIVSLSPQSIYAVNQKGDMSILNRETGKLMGTVPLPKTKFQVFNEENDRIFLVTADGLVQCLHEVGINNPVKYRESSTEIAGRLTPEADVAISGNGAGDNAETKPGSAPKIAPKSQDDAVNPFGEATGAKPEKAPVKETKKSDDPFGDDDIFN